MATFSVAAATTNRLVSSGIASALCTPAEAESPALTPQQAAGSENEVLTGLGFGRTHVELMAKAIRKGERTITVDAAPSP